MTLMICNAPPTPQPVRILALLRRAGVPLTGRQLATALGEWPAVGAMDGLRDAGAIEAVRGDDGYPCGWRDVRRAWGRSATGCSRAVTDDGGYNMTHVIPPGNWTTALADAIQDAADGDTIIVRSQAMVNLGKLAQGRMCPDKRLTFQIAPDAEAVRG